MISSRKIFILILALVLPIFAYEPGLSHADSSDEPIYAGAAKADITPPAGTPIAGYGKRKGKSSAGIHDPLFARAVSVSKGDKSFVFVSVDLVLVDENLREKVLKKIRKKIPFNDSQFVLFATHNHAGSGAIGGRFWERFIMGKFRKDVFEKTTDGIASAVIGALAEKTRVIAEYGEERIDDLVENRMDQRLDYPDILKVLRFKKENGEIAGQFVFMAAHPTLVPAKSFLISSDFPGVLTKTLDEKFPGSVSVFVNGAAADLRPDLKQFPATPVSESNPHQNRFDQITAYGKTLADKIENMAFKRVSLDGPWTSITKKTKLPRVQLRRGWIKAPSILGNRFFPTKSYFQSVRLGPLLFLAFPGEMGSEIGYEIEGRVRGKSLTPFIIGYAHDFIGYVVPRRHYLDQHQYEAQVSFYGKKMDWFIQKQADRFTDEVLTGQEKTALNPPGIIFREQGMPVLILQGDAFHTGFEEGRLLREEIRAGVDQIYRYLRGHIPVPLVNRLIINSVIANGWKKMEPYVSYEEYEQMRGIAQGAGISMGKIRAIHALPEIYPTFCSNGAYWGKATEDGHLVATRTLDWDRKIGIHEHAAVKFYVSPHPNPLPEGEGRVRVSYANIGYGGFSGVLSGINEHGISVGQIGATSVDETMKGTPMPFLLKRILEESASVDNAVKIVRRNFLTRGYNYVFADAIRKEAVVVETTRSHMAVFRDNDPQEKNVPYALPVENAVFRGDPALDPIIRDLQKASHGKPEKPGLEAPGGSAYEIRYLKHGKLVQQNYGKINPEIAKSIARDIAAGSNIQSVVYAFPDFWVANAKGKLKAAEMEYVHLNFDELKKRASTEDRN